MKTSIIRIDNRVTPLTEDRTDNLTAHDELVTRARITIHRAGRLVQKMEDARIPPEKIDELMDKYGISEGLAQLHQEVDVENMRRSTLRSAVHPS